MREIKFRVWTGLGMEYNVTTGKFGTFFVNPGSKGDGLDEKDSASLTSFNTKYSEPVALMQFTGLKDKNGKEIYESDICRYEFLEGEWAEQPVVYSGAAFMLHGMILNQINRAEAIGTIEVEIIGNIYENPSLLSK